MSEERLRELAKNVNMPANPLDCAVVLSLLREKGIIAEWGERAQRLAREAEWARRKGGKR